MDSSLDDNERIVRRVAVATVAWGVIGIWGWQSVLAAAAITLPLGFTRGKEYAEPEWPIAILIAVGHPDALVVDDHDKQGKAINQDLRRDHWMREMPETRLYARARAAAARGPVPPRFILERVQYQVDLFLKPAADRNVLVTSLAQRTEKLADLAPAARAKALADAARIVDATIRPAYRRVRTAAGPASSGCRCAGPRST